MSTKEFSQNEKILSRISIGNGDECWLWTGFKNEHGYGRMKFNGKATLAHRAIWFIHYGEIPESMCVCHRCDVPACCNPSHLFLGTHKDNMLDCKAKGRNASGDRSGARTHPETVPRGSRNGKTKLTDLDVIEIRSMASLKIQQKEIADKFGISRNGVSCIVNKKRWAHLT
jgi:predicted DNA-binding protein (UPF0251 family)